MNILYIADNRNRLNWGCRGTSIALKQMLQQNHSIVGTIYGDVSFSYHAEIIKKSRHNFSTFFLKIYSRLCSKYVIFNRCAYLLDKDNIVSENIEKSVEKFAKHTNYNSYYNEIIKIISLCDAVVVNGEGTFIFSTPPRYDTLFYLILIKYAQNIGKKTFCLNSMFSDSPSSKKNISILKKASVILSKCVCVTARDPISYIYYKHNMADNVTYIPDALFTWVKYSSYSDVVRKYPLALFPFPEEEKYWNDYLLPDRYICLSGSSLASQTPHYAVKAYKKLAESISRRWKLIIVPTCTGDYYLNSIACELNLPIFALNSNIIGGMSLLHNADVFVSGRWHPSILASSGGTPCVFLGSNSHKTKAIQEMLEYNKVVEYNAIPSDEEISRIIEDIDNILEMGETLRHKIKHQSIILSNQAYYNCELEKMKKNI